MGQRTTNTQDVGKRASIICYYLWRLDLKFVKRNSVIDREGTDAYLHEESVQIKGDTKIIISDNLYHEIWEKTKGHPEQEWRPSPSNANIYIFVTWNELEGFAIMISTKSLYVLEEHKEMTQISPTSIGYLISLTEAEPYIIEKKLFSSELGTL